MLTQLQEVYVVVGLHLRDVKEVNQCQPIVYLLYALSHLLIARGSRKAIDQWFQLLHTRLQRSRQESRFQVCLYAVY